MNIKFRNAAKILIVLFLPLVIMSIQYFAVVGLLFPEEFILVQWDQRGSGKTFIVPQPPEKLRLV